MYRKVVIGAIALMMASHLILYSCVVGNYQRFFHNNEKTTMERMLQYQHESLVQFFEETEAIMALVSTDEIIHNSKVYLNLQDQHQQREYAENMDALLNELNVSSSYVESIQILGQNHNQAQFQKWIGKTGWSSEKLPSVDDLEQAGILSSLLRNGGDPVYIQKRQLYSLLEKHVSIGWDNDQLTRVAQFMDQTDQRIVFCRYRSNVLVLLTLRPDFITNFIHPLEGKGAFTLRDDQGNLIGSSNGQASVNGNAIPERPTLSMNLEHYRFRLEWVSSATSNYAIGLFLLIGSLFIAISVWITKKISKSMGSAIFGPIRRMAGLISRHKDRWPLAPLPERAPESVMTKWPLRWKLVYLYGSSVIVPILVLGMLYTYIFYTMSKSDVVASTKALSQQISLYTSQQLRSYEQLADYVYVTEDRLEHPGAALVHPRMSNVAYADRYNRLGILEPFHFQMVASQAASIEPAILSSSFTRILWLPQQSDAIGRSVPSIARRIYVDGATAGYIVLRLKQGALEPSFAKQAPGIIVWDVNRQMMYRSASDLSLKQSKSLLVKTGLNANGDRQIAVIQSLDAVNAESRKLVVTLTLLAGILACSAFLFAYWFSYRVVTKLEQFGEAMEKTGSGEWSTVIVDGNDEVSELSRSFNRMIEEIKQLLEAKIESQVREERLTALKSKAELHMLQQQINPHFLYNTLQSINMKAKAGDQLGVSEMVGAFADMIRFAIGKGPMEVPFATELEHITNYCTILKARYRDKLQVEWDIDAGTLALPVLKFILQPIVENAIHHGIAKQSRGGKVHIKAYTDESYLFLIVEDDGVGMDEEEADQLQAGCPEAEPHTETGVGLSNVIRRLRIFYQSKADLTVQSELMRGTKVTIRLPVHTSK